MPGTKWICPTQCVSSERPLKGHALGPLKLSDTRIDWPAPRPPFESNPAAIGGLDLRATISDHHQ